MKKEPAAVKDKKKPKAETSPPESKDKKVLQIKLGSAGIQDKKGSKSRISLAGIQDKKKNHTSDRKVMPKPSSRRRPRVAVPDSQPVEDDDLRELTAEEIPVKEKIIIVID